jgi:hypothetical protein
MVEAIGICSGEGPVLCRMRAGRDFVSVAKSGRRYHALVNGRAVVAAKSEQDFESRAIPVVAAMAFRMCGEGGTLVIDRRAGMETFVKYVRQNAKPLQVKVLESKPDEEGENIPNKEASAPDLPLGLSKYSEHLSETGRNVDAVSHLADVLLRTNLAKNMWGSREVSAVLNGVKGGLEGLRRDAGDMDARMERAANDARYVRTCVAGSLVHGQARAAAGRILEDFPQIKAYQSELSQTLHRLYDIDRTFKACTGYPATWFLMSSILMDFMFEFESLIGGMIRGASVETAAMEPLMAWRISTGEHQNV